MEIEVSQDYVCAEIEYTVRDSKHDEEKPYDLRYNVYGAIPMTNTENERKKVHIHNFRVQQDADNFEKFGFSVERVNVNLTNALFDDESIIEAELYPAVEKILWQKFPGAFGVYILEHNLRKRHPSFPHHHEKFHMQYTQPARLAHIDFSLEAAVKTARSAFSLPPEHSQRVIAINFWKSLQGLGNDWPLALCDKRTILHATDTVITDIVYHDRVTENESIYYRPEHKWFYIKDLANNELIMFLQKDSDFEGGGGVAHTSFDNPDTDKEAHARTSIELRTFVAFA